MASPKLQRGRHSLTSAYYTVTTITQDRRPIFHNPILARIAAREFDVLSHENGAESLAWVVMPDHVHWLLQLQEQSLSRCVQRFKSRAARAINSATGSQGGIWQAGYYDHRLRNEDDLVEQARYIIANPVRRGLVPRIGDYPHWWCRWVIGGNTDW